MPASEQAQQQFYQGSDETFSVSLTLTHSNNTFELAICLPVSFVFLCFPSYRTDVFAGKYAVSYGEDGTLMYILYPEQHSRSNPQVPWNEYYPKLLEGSENALYWKRICLKPVNKIK